MFTPELEAALHDAYTNMQAINDHQPIIRASRQATAVIQQASMLRRKDWASTSRWNEAADFTGLMCELAMQRYCGISAESAMADFKAGLQGDAGYDLIAGGLKIDVKGTCGSALRYKFSKTNRNTAKADCYGFVYVEAAGFETRAYLLGWCHRTELKPYLRDDGVRNFVRAETLRRAGKLKSVAQLLQPPLFTTYQTISQ